MPETESTPIVSLPQTALVQAAFNASPDAIAGVDERGRLVLFSPSAERLFGYGCEEVTGISLSMLLPDCFEWLPVAEMSATDAAPATAPASKLYRQEGVDRQGNRFPLELMCSVAQVEEQKFILVCMRNVSGRKTLEDELARRVHELEGQSRTDKLTGLFNRRYFDEVLDLEFRRACRYQTPLSLMLIDVDYFKQYNDTYGHVKGDEVLARLGSILAGLYRRSSDTAARYGGEEFAVIMGNCEMDRARLQAQTLQQALQKAAIEHRSSSVAPVITISAGIYTMVPAIGEQENMLLAESDKCLYTAKRELGRNAIHAAGRELGS